MKFKRANEFEKEHKNSNGFKDMTASWLWTAEDDMVRFAMRLMEFEPGGYTSYHNHLEEHQFYFLEGQAIFVDTQGDEHCFSPGDTVYCAPKKSHQIKNAGNTVLRMLCMIPILPGRDGKKTTPVPAD